MEERNSEQDSREKSEDNKDATLQDRVGRWSGGDSLRVCGSSVKVLQAVGSGRQAQIVISAHATSGRIGFEWGSNSQLVYYGGGGKPLYN
eukprot:867702-Rhodomonas_salina.1